MPAPYNFGFAYRRIMAVVEFEMVEPDIAAVNGIAMGDGLAFALHCDRGGIPRTD